MKLQKLIHIVIGIVCVGLLPKSVNAVSHGRPHNFSPPPRTTYLTTLKYRNLSNRSENYEN